MDYSQRRYSDCRGSPLGGAGGAAIRQRCTQVPLRDNRHRRRRGSHVMGPAEEVLMQEPLPALVIRCRHRRRVTSPLSLRAMW
ncbi:MAG: hypothetical protein MZV63_54875 [Marinilabiliales bacterium]|nr:hypothetical protein [Marinilabiliales bacterium]